EVYTYYRYLFTPRAKQPPQRVVNQDQPTPLLGVNQQRLQFVLQLQDLLMLVQQGADQQVHTVHVIADEPADTVAEKASEFEFSMSTDGAAAASSSSTSNYNKDFKQERSIGALIESLDILTATISSLQISIDTSSFQAAVKTFTEAVEVLTNGRYGNNSGFLP
ncbi:Vacuolar protein sorting-associated protein 51-like protein, partial [Frankliniella fusca]